MIEDINNLIDTIDASLRWADEYHKETFPCEELREYRRKLRRYARSLSVNPSVAAYGESQVGKSYLMSSLLSSPESQFVIDNGGKRYSFIDEINPSGGSNTMTESTGVVTRFTTRGPSQSVADKVRVTNLSVADIIMLITDAYYHDIKIDAGGVLRYDQINDILKETSHYAIDGYHQSFLTADDIKDICDYIDDTVGGMAAAVRQSDFRSLASRIIANVKPENWVNVCGVLWNCNEEFNRLFTTLIGHFSRLDFATDVYVPFDAVRRDRGTLLKIEWLDGILGNIPLGDTDVPVTDVYDADGRVIAADYPKSALSALTAELTFNIPPSLTHGREFLKRVDLLDFPGARSREKFKEQQVKEVLPTILRRGKVAYLFNKYSRELNISGVLFCHHNAQKAEASLGDTISSWIEQNIGRSPADRAKYLTTTNGVSPLMMIATKFNIELERTKLDYPDAPEQLNEHWRRFKTVIPEIVKPAAWLDRWVTRGGIFPTESFQSIYLLRDYYWSGKNRVFDGFSDGTEQSAETAVHPHPDYPDYFDRLRDSFLNNEFVKAHFHSPAEAWQSVASVNRDGSREIIRDLNAISTTLDDARRLSYGEKVAAISREIRNKLSVYYEPQDVEQNNRRIRTIIREILLALDKNVGGHPETFGNIIDSLMVPAVELRKIAYNIAVLHTERPIDSDVMTMMRTSAGIEPGDARDTAISKLCAMYLCDNEDELTAQLHALGVKLDTLVSGGSDVATTMADVISNRIIEYWINFINSRAAALEKLMPHADEVAFMLQNMCLLLGVRRRIAERTEQYTRMFQEEDIPNAIADFASLTFNNFVSTVGSEYITPEISENIDSKARACNVKVPQISTSRVPGAVTPDHNLIQALKAFDDAHDLGEVSLHTLMKLPFWVNYNQWKANLIKGLLLVTDISNVDPKANHAIGEIIEKIR